MVESLLLSQLPKWKHSGQLAEGVMYSPAPAEIAAQDRRYPIVLVQEGNHSDSDVDKNIHLYKVVTTSVKRPRSKEEILDLMAHGMDVAEAHQPAREEISYLIPHYKIDDPAISNKDVAMRDLDLLRRRATKFFYLAQARIDVIRDKDSIAANIASLSPAFKSFTFEGKQYRTLTAEQRQHVNDAAMLVGHVIARIESLGKIIITHDMDMDSRLNFSSEYVHSHMDELRAEFATLRDFINSDVGQRMCQCVMTRDGRKDNDKIFAHLAREICKPVMFHLPENIKPKGTQTPEEAETKAAENFEGIVRGGIVHDLAATMLAIDQVYKGMRVMMEHPRFVPYAQRVQSVIQRDLAQHSIPTAHELDISAYRGMVREYVELSRAQVGIRTEDHEDFDRIESRLKFLRGEIHFCHEAMSEFARQTQNKVAQLTVPLLKRGIALITEMNELRLPRNEKASGIDGAQSTVERYTQKVQTLLDGTIKGGADLGE